MTALGLELVVGVQSSHLRPKSNSDRPAGVLGYRASGGGELAPNGESVIQMSLVADFFVRFVHTGVELEGERERCPREWVLKG